MARMPSDKEITETGELLGHGPGPYPTRLRAQIAETIQLSRQMAKEERQDTTDVEMFVAKANLLRDKLRPTFSSQGCEDIVAALAPTIYRESKDRTPAQ